MYHLLIVDDEPLVRRGIKTFIDFKQLNIDQVYEASDGEQALSIFKDHDIDIVLADINMPKMNGLEFSKAVKADKPDTCVALITGYDYFDYAVSALKVGVDDYILKPVSKSDIHALLVKLVSLCDSRYKQKQVQQIIPEGVVDKGSYKSQLMTLIDENLTNPNFSLTFAADHIGLSNGYLSGVFKEAFGLPFQEYVLNTRLEKAKILLLTTNMKNYEIAEAVGFEDSSYFSSRFKKQFGLSPKQFKNSREG